MSCINSADGKIHLCAASPRSVFCRTGTCPDCKQWTRFIGVSYEWYGSDQTCLKCGRSWSDGEWMPLDFVPQSRQKSIASAKRLFRAASKVVVK